MRQIPPDKRRYRNVGLWPIRLKATFRKENLSGCGTQDCRNEQISSRFSVSLGVRHLMGEESFDDPAAFGWVIEKG
jgi:hypothetical protein